MTRNSEPMNLREAFYYRVGRMVTSMVNTSWKDELNKDKLSTTEAHKDTVIQSNTTNPSKRLAPSASWLE